MGERLSPWVADEPQPPIENTTHRLHGVFERCPDHNRARSSRRAAEQVERALVLGDTIHAHIWRASDDVIKCPLELLWSVG